VQAWRPFTPLLTRNFPRKLLRIVADRVPWPAFQDLKHCVDTLSDSTGGIWQNKKALYLKGDQSVVNEYGQGKDIMSILCKFSYPSYPSIAADPPDSEGKPRVNRTRPPFGRRARCPNDVLDFVLRVTPSG